MFPGFCTKPTDLLASFKGIARSLGMALNDRPDLHLCICQALRTLINKSCETGELVVKTITQNMNIIFFLLLSIFSMIWDLWLYIIFFFFFSGSSAEEEKSELQKFSKNFLPILFNVYSQQPKPGGMASARMAVLDTIRVYLSITEQAVINLPY